MAKKFDSKALSGQSKIADAAFSKAPRVSFDGEAADVSVERYWRAMHDWARASKVDEGVPLYLHLPFCPVRGTQSTRVAEITHSDPPIDNYLELLHREISTVTKNIGVGRRVSQLYIGGGTPNYLSNSQLIRLAETIDAHFDVAEGAERTIEIDPSRASYAQLSLLRGLGFTHLQFELLEFLSARNAGIGRSYSPDLLHDVFSTARALGFKGIAVDITYGARNTSRDDVLEELECLLELKPDRILCHAAQTSFAENDEHHISDQPKPLSQAAKLSMFVSMLDVFELCGYEWVGVSGFALPGDAWCEAQAEGRLYRNWIGYTTERAFSVLGFGLGAVTELPGLIAQNHEDLRAWSALVTAGLPAVGKGVELNTLKAKEREILTCLSANLNAEAPAVMDSAIVSDLKESGVIEADAGRLSLTPFGRAFFSQVHEWDRNQRLGAN